MRLEIQSTRPKYLDSYVSMMAKQLSRLVTISLLLGMILLGITLPSMRVLVVDLLTKVKKV